MISYRYHVHLCGVMGPSYPGFSCPGILPGAMVFFLSVGLLALRRILHSAKMKNRTIGRDEPAKNATCRKIATLTAQQPLDKHRRLWYNSLVHRQQLLCVFQTAKQCEIRVLAAFSSAVFCRIFMRRLEGHGYGSAANRRPSGLDTDRLRVMLRRRRSEKAGIRPSPGWTAACWFLPA